MTPTELIKAGKRIYGEKKWVPSLARDLGIDRGTIYRMLKKPEIEPVYVVAVTGLIDLKKRRREIEKAARAMMPRRRRNSPKKASARPSGKK
jgi:hypothetical protein